MCALSPQNIVNTTIFSFLESMFCVFISTVFEGINIENDSLESM